MVCAEEAEDLPEHLTVETGALCLLDLGNSPSEVGSALQARVRGDTFQLSHSTRMSVHSALWIQGRCPAREQAGMPQSGAPATSQERWARRSSASIQAAARGRAGSFPAAVRGPRLTWVPQAPCTAAVLVRANPAFPAALSAAYAALWLFRRGHFRPGGYPAPCIFWAWP